MTPRSRTLAAALVVAAAAGCGSGAGGHLAATGGRSASPSAGSSAGWSGGTGESPSASPTPGTTASDTTGPTESATPSSASPTPSRPRPRRPPAVTPDQLGTLPQTRALPTTTALQFAAGVRALWTAVVTDQPDRGLPFFFPVTAYRQLKALPDPTADYENRLIALYRLDVHAAHALLGPDAPTARLVGVTVPTADAVWVDPGEEDNTIGYYRVYGTRLHYVTNGSGQGGKTGSFGLFSLISWRGEWYLVHLGPNPRPSYDRGYVDQPGP